MWVLAAVDSSSGSHMRISAGWICGSGTARSSGYGSCQHLTAGRAVVMGRGLFHPHMQRITGEQDVLRRGLQKEWLSQEPASQGVMKGTGGNFLFGPLELVIRCQD